MAKAQFLDPYKHFYNLYPPQLEEGEEFEDILAEYDDNLNIMENKENIEVHIKDQISHALKSKNKHVAVAMEHDPSFMVDPVKDFYKKLIPESLIKQLTQEQIEELIAIYDPVTWGMKYLRRNHNGWRPRVSKSGIPYQSQMIRCLSKRIVARAGRRIGKSISLIVRVLHRAFTFSPNDDKSHFNIVIFTPNQAQIETLFKMMEFLIDGNRDLLSMIKEGGKIPTRKTPNYTLEFTNGVTIKGFVSGSTAVRSSAADFLVLDEASFLEPEDTDAVIALLAENNDVELWVSSTPKGLKDYFYERVHDKNFVSFYFPTDKFHPHWSLQMMLEFKDQLTDSGYSHEVLAEFSADGEGVYQIKFIDGAKKPYRYEDQAYNPNWIYAIGVDWNDQAIGTQIYVIGYDVANPRYKVVDRASVSIDGWTQIGAVKKVRELTRKWHPEIVYCDYGFGSTQIELLHEYGSKASVGSPERILTKAQSVNFSSSIEIRDPWTKKKVKKPTKAYMINNSVRVFENFLIDISEYDTTLIKQLEGYVIDRITPSGIPIYAPDPKHGDHALDAAVLALFGFHMEKSSLGKPRLNEKAAIVAGAMRVSSNQPYYDPAQAEADKMLQRDKAHERQIYLDAHATINEYAKSAGELGRRSSVVTRASRETQRPKRLRI